MQTAFQADAFQFGAFQVAPPLTGLIPLDSAALLGVPGRPTATVVVPRPAGALAVPGLSVSISVPGRNTGTIVAPARPDATLEA